MIKGELNMGFNFKKVFNLGKGFKTTASKSGVGFSWGMKGFRITKTAKGDIKNTFSIPGTGISYTHNVATKKGKFKIFPIILALLVLGAIIVYNNPKILQGALENLGIKNSLFNEEPKPVLNETTPGESKESYVYVSASGEKYHLESCRTLKENKNKLSLEKAISEGYEPCQICKPPVK
jgi:hypothetical protein